MATEHNQGGASASLSFTPSEWFAQWSDHGGIALVAADRLYLSRFQAIDHTARQRLDTLGAQIIADRQHGEALAAYLVARSFGEVRR
jgi:hypothetical protein